MITFFKKFSISTKFLLPLTVIVFIIAAVIAGYFYFFQLGVVAKNSNEKIALAEASFNNLKNRDTKALSAVLNMLLDDEKISELYLNDDRDALYEYCKSRFFKNKELYGITHWYFIGLDEKVFLRVHNKEIYGDAVERVTYKKAKQANSVGSGIELGKTAFALRVVSPYYRNGELIGYMELGQKIDHFLGDMKKESSVAMALAVKKDSLSKSDWDVVRRENGLRNNWDDNQEFVIISSNAEDGSVQKRALDAFIGPKYFMRAQGDIDDNLLGNYKEGDLVFSVGGFHLIDASEKEVGVVYAVVDNSKTYRQLSLVILELSVVVLALFALFVLLTRLIVKRVIIKPLDGITSRMSVISSGEYDAKIEIKSDDELGKIAKSFNNMIIAIKDSRNNLDLKIEEQVHEIVEKGKKIEDQQKATLNILEDMQSEKIKSDRLARDLEKFQLAVAGASDHIVITDMEGAILYMNKSAEKITGYSAAESFGRKAGSKELWGGKMPDDFYKKLWKTIKNDKKIFSGEISNVRKNGEQYAALASISPIIGENGEVKFFVGIERDITKEKEIDQMKSEFVSVASHQLRTPLTGIKWFTELLLESKKLSKEQKDYIAEISNSNERMIVLVNDLLNVSRIETGKNFEVVKKETDFMDVLREVIGEQEIIAKGKKIEIDYSGDFSGKILMNIDGVKIKQVIQNLLSNAIKYSPEKSKVILGRKDSAKKMIFSVKDSGLGIPLDQQKRIFEKFFRANNVIMTGAEGTGLGLYIVRSIIESHGGKVWFESKEKKGTTFFIEISKK